MRISDWSSDVCSSDLHGPPGAEEFALGGRTTGLGGPAVRHSPPVLVADTDARMRRHGNAAQRCIEEAGRDVDVGDATERAATDGYIDRTGRQHATGAGSTVAAVTAGAADAAVSSGVTGRNDGTGSAGTGSATGTAS